MHLKRSGEMRLKAPNSKSQASKKLKKGKIKMDTFNLNIDIYL